MSVRELPAYVCHKRVRAARIKAIRIDFDGAAILKLDGQMEPLVVPAEWAERFKPKRTDPDLGVYVVYEDGYASWSPTAPFEAGYTLEEPTVQIQELPTAMQVEFPLRHRPTATVTRR